MSKDILSYFKQQRAITYFYNINTNKVSIYYLFNQKYVRLMMFFVPYKKTKNNKLKVPLLYIKNTRNVYTKQ